MSHCLTTDQKVGGSTPPGRICFCHNFTHIRFILLIILTGIRELRDNKKSFPFLSSPLSYSIDSISEASFFLFQPCRQP
jgi:hypothetical protein